MSVLTYVYPREPELIAFDSLLSILSAKGFAVAESEEKPRAIPDWSYLLLSHNTCKHLRFEFAVAQNNKSNIKCLAERHGKNRNFQAVLSAKKYIWSKIKAGNAPDRELIAGFVLYDFVLCAVARLSKGVVNLPESDLLYSASGFARYVNSKSLHTPKPG